MARCLALITLFFALVATIHGQDMTSMMFQMMGVEAPPMPPEMPSSLRQALYPRRTTPNRQRLLQLYRQRQMAAAAANRNRGTAVQQQQPTRGNVQPSAGTVQQPARGAAQQYRTGGQQQQYRTGSQQQQYRAGVPLQQNSGAAQHQNSGAIKQYSYQKSTVNNNPYSVSYRSSYRRQPSGQNSVYSPANTIRRPGTANTLAAKGPANPYSTSRQAGSRVPSIRYQAMRQRSQVPPRAARPSRTSQAANMYKMYKKIKSTPKKIREAQMAGCALPDGPEMMLMGGRCRSSAAQMVCQSKLMSCLDVELISMCCPYGMNRLAMDTLTYMKKFQRFLAEVA